MEVLYLIPVSGFFEGNGAKGYRNTRLSASPDGGYLCIAEIWEEGEEAERNYPIITTEAISLVKFHSQFEIRFHG